MVSITHTYLNLQPIEYVVMCSSNRTGIPRSFHELVIGKSFTVVKLVQQVYSAYYTWYIAASTCKPARIILFFQVYQQTSVVTSTSKLSSIRFRIP